MTTTTFKTPYTATKVKRIAVDTQEVTIPGQSMTVDMLIKRLKAGMQIARKPANYTSDPKGPIMPQFKIRSLTDLAIARDHVRAVFEEHNAKIKAAQEAAKKAENEALIAKKADELAKRTKEQDSTPNAA